MKIRNGHPNIRNAWTKIRNGQKAKKLPVFQQFAIPYFPNNYPECLGEYPERTYLFRWCVVGCRQSTIGRRAKRVGGVHLCAKEPKTAVSHNYHINNNTERLNTPVLAAPLARKNSVCFQPKNVEMLANVIVLSTQGWCCRLLATV